MRFGDVLDLLILSAVWGASFLFMRIAAPEFGPFALNELRVAIAALFLLTIFLRRGEVRELKLNWRKLAMVGTLNSAVPFCLLSFATLYLTGGFAAILNATSPLWAALIAWVWLSALLNMSRVAGLIIGFAGVIVLVWNRVSLDVDDVSLGIVAAIVASFFYGIGANYIKKKTGDISSLALATGSQMAAAIILLPGAVLFWPSEPIPTQAWISVIVMGIASTGYAYILYFRLIANVGPEKAITVTYLVPAFAMLWGAIFIGEKLTATMVIGCAIILIGTALATGLWPRNIKDRSVQRATAGRRQDTGAEYHAKRTERS